jgi:hypothetical protein
MSPQAGQKGLWGSESGSLRAAGRGREWKIIWGKFEGLTLARDPELAVALLAYSLGAGRLLRSLQREGQPQAPGAGRDERPRSISDPDTTTDSERNE